MSPLVGAVRARRPIPGVADTWDGWDTLTGERVLLRRGEAPAISPPFSCSLADLLPAEGSDPAWTARIALGALAALVRIHAAGHAHGWVGPESVVLGRDGWTLVWLGVSGGDPTDDLRAFGQLLSTIDDGALGEMGAGFAESPPPSASDAARLVVAECAAELARGHHAVLDRARRQDRSWRRNTLAALARRLGRAVRPPVAVGVIREEPDGVRLTLASDGWTVRAVRRHPDAPIGEGFTLWANGELDPVPTRAVLRAWATREGPADPALAGLTRWLSAVGRLRVDQRILARG